MRVFLFLTILFAFTLFAQTEKGTMLLGGTGSMGFSNTIALELNPTLGIFLLPNFAMGSSFPLRYTYFREYDNRQVQLRFVPFARYYFGTNANYRFFAQAKSGLIYTSEYILYPKGRETEYRRNFLMDLGAGYARFITDKVGLEAVMGLNTNEDREPELNSTFNGINLQVGILLYLHREDTN